MTDSHRSSDEQATMPQYQCWVDGCPGKHASKWEMCRELDGHDPDLDDNGICRVCGKYEPE